MEAVAALPMAGHAFRVWVFCLLLGSWLNTALFTLEVALSLFCLWCWTMPRASRCGLILILVNDTVGTFAVFANLFRFVVEGEQQENWPIAILLVSTALSAVIEQTFMVHRYWKVIRHTIWSAFIMLLAVAHIVMTVSAVGLGEPYKRVLIHNVDMTTISLIICTVADVLIALSLVWSLSGIDPVWRSTQHLIRAVCVGALTTGAVVATITILSMVTLVLNGLDRIIFGIFVSIMGRVYSLTILVNFIRRRRQLSAANSPPVRAENIRRSPLSIAIGSSRPASSVDVRETRRTPEEEARSLAGSPHSEYALESTGEAAEFKGELSPLSTTSALESQPQPRIPYVGSPR
ncbi:hypothetical protein C8F04DRAFT_233348 [Mycena alexandri]|uniref:DUF6534 domain-containing protein n=1 Tax=Mycena alexandri TaxID=1745969 RepID=A0AAD6S7P1_9AGAR|nr:hypothetical protein C8F04DRAFT_233348 [Mycena alexandri]